MNKVTITKNGVTVIIEQDEVITAESISGILNLIEASPAPALETDKSWASGWRPYTGPLIYPQWPQDHRPYYYWTTNQSGALSVTTPE